MSVLRFQIQNNWSYGETLDENAKTHPMLRPYKTFSEKVGPPSPFASSSVFSSHLPRLSLTTLTTDAPGQGDLPLANQGVHQSHDRLGVEPR